MLKNDKRLRCYTSVRTGRADEVITRNGADSSPLHFRIYKPLDIAIEQRRWSEGEELVSAR